MCRTSVTGIHRQNSSRGAGYKKERIVIDDAIGQPYVTVLADEQQLTTTSLLAHAVGWFSEKGITCRRVL